MKGKRLCRIILQSFCSLAAILCSLDDFFSARSEEVILMQLKRFANHCVNVVLTIVIKVGKGFTGFFWRRTKNSKGWLGTLGPTALLYAIPFINLLSPS